MVKGNTIIYSYKGEDLGKKRSNVQVLKNGQILLKNYKYSVINPWSFAKYCNPLLLISYSLIALIRCSKDHWRTSASTSGNHFTSVQQLLPLKLKLIRGYIAYQFLRYIIANIARSLVWNWQGRAVVPQHKLLKCKLCS